jgi:glyoxylase-like metal-dependent hydrolase (beta-lactamase superfamily II)
MNGSSLSAWLRRLQIRRMRLHHALILLGLSASAHGGSGSSPDSTPPPVSVAPGVWLIPGSMRPDREPDGNSVLFEAPDGFVVVDTGRHEWHRHAILTFVQDRGRTIAAIINSHWHLDHVSGNPDLRIAFPNVRVYASDAINGALTGFLAESVRNTASHLDDPAIPADLRADMRADIASVQNGTALKPDVVIAASGPLTIAGRHFQIHLARNAATAGDVWVYDERERIAAVGDLVTLPVPFLDTACPDGWRRALREVAGVHFTTLLPGHGPPMTRAHFATYQRQFDAFIACSASERPADECASAWILGVRSLLPSDSGERERAVRMARYYTEMLRANGGRSKYCMAAIPANGGAG